MSNYAEILDGNMSNYVGNVEDNFIKKYGILQSSVDVLEDNVNSIINTGTIDLSAYLPTTTVEIIQNNGFYTYKFNDIMVADNSVTGNSASLNDDIITLNDTKLEKTNVEITETIDTESISHLSI